MTQTTIAGHTVDVTADGYLSNPEQWTEELAPALAANAGITELTEEHWKIIRFLREDYVKTGNCPTIARVNSEGGFAVDELFRLFPGKPAKKMAYVAGLTAPTGCV